MIRIALPLATLALLAACGSEPAPVTSDADANAEGDVLEGSISDAMLPLDTVTSKSPSARGDDEDSDSDESAEEGE